MISVKLAGFDRGRGVIRAGAGVSTLGISEEPLTPPPHGSTLSTSHGVGADK